MSSYSYPGWPYAAKAICQHSWNGATTLSIWLTFSFPMNINNTPSTNLFKIKRGIATGNPVTVEWIDEFTLKLTIASSLNPTTCYVQYLGPDADLATKWGKQWEPWGYIYSTDIA